MAESREARDQTSTLPDDLPLARLRRARVARRTFFAFLCLLLASAFAGLLGVRTGEAKATGGGYEVTVEHPSIIRPGLPTHFGIELRRPGGFPGVVTVAALSDYLDLFDENGFDPDPVTATTDEQRLIWTFDPPPGDTMVISLDARLEPGIQLKRAKGWVEVLEDGAPVVRVNFRTLVLG